jgi:chaperonin GroES
MIATNIRPLHAQIVVKLAERESTTPGGIFIPDVAQEKPTYADVVAVGPGARLDDGSRRPVAVRVGERVLLEKRTIGTKFIGVDGADLLVIHEANVLGVVE